MSIPEEFVYLNEINPNIISNLRYFSNENFIGHPIVGYERNVAILTKQAAEALSKAQQEFEQNDYTLVIYDAYRPRRSVEYFLEWNKNLSDQRKKKEYYPFIEKAEVFDLGYVAKKSGHTRGSTVDLTIAKIGNKIEDRKWVSRKLEDGREILFLDDGTLDMGSSFDLFDQASHQDSPIIASPYTEHRNYLRNVMMKHGFRPNPREWWHYSFIDEPFPDTYFEFHVK
uniref:D-Ala-D-Ala dipeptidase n=1 Tax=Acrobeloides nanus TaxID=290746 RepID=A0A914CLL8_9BILA